MSCGALSLLLSNNARLVTSRSVPSLYFARTTMRCFSPRPSRFTKRVSRPVGSKTRNLVNFWSPFTPGVTEYSIATQATSASPLTARVRDGSSGSCGSTTG